MTSPPPNPDLAEEISSINAIYDPSTITLTTTTTTTTTASSPALPIETTIIFTLADLPPSLATRIPTFLLGFDASYPSTPPRVLGTASTSNNARRGEGRKWVDILTQVVESVWTAGAVCLFDVIGEMGERVSASEDADVTGDDGEGGGDGGEEGQDAAEGNGNAHTTKPESKDNGIPDLPSPPAWTLSDVVTEKKSVFVARAARVESRAQAEMYLDHLLATEKKVAAATHNITAWRIREKVASSSTQSTSTTTTTGNNGVATDVRIYQDFDDDGETAAGGRMLHLMQLMDVWDVVVVVTRWYGGVKLGPDRFRIINGVARDALVKGGFERGGGDANAGGAGAGGQEKGKKKGRR